MTFKVPGVSRQFKETGILHGADGQAKPTLVRLPIPTWVSNQISQELQGNLAYRISREECIANPRLLIKPAQHLPPKKGEQASASKVKG